MRFSAWSSRVISVCSALAAVALTAPAPAEAHVTVVPVSVEEDVPTRVQLDVPNERRAEMTGLTLDVPAGIEIVRADAPAGWRVSTRPVSVRWDGGRLGIERSLRFPVTLRAAGPPGTETLVAVQRYGDGATVRWEPTLTVLPGPVGAAPSSHLGRALAAAILGLVVVVTSIALLHRFRRQALQER